MTKRLVIIGAGREQSRAYQLAKAHGCFVVGTDQDPQAPAFRYADTKLICSTRNVRQSADTVSRFAKKYPVHGVMTVANDVPLTVATIARQLGLPGISVASAKRCADKLLMKRSFQKRRVPTPPFWAIKNHRHLLECLKKAPGKKFILKPVDGRGSRGVIFLDGSTDPRWAYNESLAQSGHGKLLLEAFIPGPQLSVEGLFINGRYRAIAFADRNYDNLPLTRPYVVEDGGVIPSKYRGAILNRIAGAIEAAAKSLGIRWGSVKADIILQNGKPVVLELAARLSGNYLATHHIPLAYGVDIVSALIRLSLGETLSPDTVKTRLGRYLGVRYFFPAPGRIQSIRGAETVKKLNYVRFLDIYKKAGDRQLKITHHGERGGTLICEGPDYKTALRRVQRAVKKIKFCVATS